MCVCACVCVCAGARVFACVRVFVCLWMGPTLCTQRTSTQTSGSTAHGKGQEPYHPLHTSGRFAWNAASQSSESFSGIVVQPPSSSWNIHTAPARALLMGTAESRLLLLVCASSSWRTLQQETSTSQWRAHGQIPPTGE